MTNPPRATVLGYPRQGDDRQLKRAIERYWAGGLSADQLLDSVAAIRQARLRELMDAGLTEVPINDFSLYDHVLDTAWMLGAIPQRHRDAVPDVTTADGRLGRYFAMGRGTTEAAPLEMTKWFDTNYHYLVPEIAADTAFALDAAKPVQELVEAIGLGAPARPVIVGPVTFLLLSKPSPGQPLTWAPLDEIDRLLPLYADLLGQLKAAGADWVQIDEPALVQDQPASVLAVAERVYATLGALTDRPRILVASYFDELGEALPILAAAPIEGLALDFTGPARSNLAALASIGGLPNRRLVAGVVDGRNVWATDLSGALATLEALSSLAGTVDVSASCSLLHVPLDIALERTLAPEVRPWLAFARQKLAEITVLARGASRGHEAIAAELGASDGVRAARSSSPIVRVESVRARVARIDASDFARPSPYDTRRVRQGETLSLPPLPTTTIGSFPQTASLRKARAALRAGTLSVAQYEAQMRQEIADVVALQHELDLDVLVHGEPERNDMVQYFAEQLDGFAATEHGWVQSYGTRYVRPPIIVGDVARPKPMTVEWARYAQSLTAKAMKGMLTGPVTMLAWSFVRDDLPVSETAAQVALALRDEVADLAAAGIRVVQVDEPALRETLPLRTAARAPYLAWAVDAFRLTTAGAPVEMQIHTHMCYADFDDVLSAIIAMDADVISLEAARSDMTIAGSLARVSYPNQIGPGVWDIHSPRVPTPAEMESRLRAVIEAFPLDRIWVNPDCGLKTRGYAEVRESLRNMVTAAQAVRQEH